MSEKILGANSVKTPEEKATLERRQLQLIERRHEMAVASLRIEQILRESSSDETTNELSKKIEKELSDIEPSLKPTYLKAVERFFKRKKSVSAFYTALLKRYTPTNRAELSTRFRRGRVIFVI